MLAACCLASRRRWTSHSVSSQRTFPPSTPSGKGCWVDEWARDFEGYKCCSDTSPDNETCADEMIWVQIYDDHTKCAEGRGSVVGSFENCTELAEENGHVFLMYLE